MRQHNPTRNIAVTISVAIGLLLVLVACTSNAPAPPAPAPTATSEAAIEASATATPAPAAVAVGDQATLVVQLDDSRTVIRKIDFTAPISGLALLLQSDLDVVQADFEWGTAVCSIEGVGCPAEDCFCNDNLFWNYLTWQNEAWMGYPVGPAQSVISATGAVEGWQWGTGTTPPAAVARLHGAEKALTWLRAQQVITDGSFASSPAASVEGLLALGANREDAPELLDFVLSQGAGYAEDGVSEAGKLAVALSAADACWPVDAMKPTDYYSPTIGALHSDAGPLAWGILGTLALDEPTPTDSVDYLLSLALPEGGWEWSPEWGRDTNSTALALQALVAAGVPVTNSTIISGQAYLQAAQSDEGGFSYDPNASWGNVADSNSTAYVLQAFAALGMAAPDAAIAFLLSVQDDGGALGWQTAQPAPNLGSTQQAIPALLGQPYPLQRVSLPNCP